MNVSPKQKAILISLYRRYVESGRRDTFVATKGITTVTLKSLFKTGYIETDRVIKDVPSNMRISDSGIEKMKEYFETKKKSLDTILNRNKRFMRFVQNTDDKRLVLLNYLCPCAMIKYPEMIITHKGYGIFEVHINGKEDTYYGVYNLTEGNDVEVGACEVRNVGSQKYFIERMRML